VAIEHDFFGLIEEDGDRGLRWSETIEVGDQPVEVELVATDASAVDQRALAVAAAMASTLEGLDARGRDVLVAQLSERESAASQYVDRRMDDMGESLLDLLVHNSGDIAMDVLRSLQLVRVVLHPDASDEGEAFAELLYAIDPDQEDAELIVSFDDRGDVVAIDLGE